MDFLKERQVPKQNLTAERFNINVGDRKEGEESLSEYLGEFVA